MRPRPPAMAPALLLTFLAAGCASGPTEPDAFPDAFLASSYDTPAGLSLLEPSVPNAEWWGWRSSGVVEDNPGRLNLSAWPNTRLGAGTVQQGHVAYYVSASHRDAALGSFALRFPDAAQASAWLD
ncbi:MAG TPA: hypothetical protein VFH47_06035, partial [Candidatus Thermoplasmatota archaeon]|nr:hypothetical protein [Candidatus Thermoplasmatota archaeon]